MGAGGRGAFLWGQRAVAPPLYGIKLRGEIPSLFPGSQPAPSEVQELLRGGNDPVLMSRGDAASDPPAEDSPSPGSSRAQLWGSALGNAKTQTPERLPGTAPRQQVSHPGTGLGALQGKYQQPQVPPSDH